MLSQKSRRILLTGASGFLGAAFAEAALDAGHSVAALTRSSESAKIVALTQHESASRFVVLEGSLENPPWQKIEDYAPDTIVHMAWVVTPGAWAESPENATLRDSSRTFMQGCVKLGVSHILSMGSCAEYKITGGVLTEDSELGPETAYGAAKIGLATDLATDCAAAGVSLCWPRLFYGYGPGEHPGRLPTATYNAVKQGEEIVLNNPTSTKDHVYVDDVTAALLLLLDKEATGEYNIGTGEGESVHDLALAVASHLGRPELVVASFEPSSDPLSYVIANAAKLRSLGWKPSVSITEGAAKLCMHLDKH